MVVIDAACFAALTIYVVLQQGNRVRAYAKVV